MLDTKSEDWSLGIRRQALFPLFRDGIFTQDGEEWRRSRRLLRPRMTHRQYEDLRVFEESTNDLLATCTMLGAGSQVLDLQPLFFSLALDVTTRFLFRTPISRVATTSRTFAEAFDVAQDFVAKRMRLQELYWLIGGRQFRQACTITYGFADQIITENLAGNYNGTTFLQDLAGQFDDRNELRSQIMNILIAGRDTTAYLISWTFFHLVRHPNVIRRLRREIYSKNVLNEVLRLHPPIAVNSRTAIRDTCLPVGGGARRDAPVFIPKGTLVGYSTYAMHRRTDLYGMDAELFRPERWSESMPLDDNVTLAKWGYLPFNGGPRLCLGRDFSLTEAAYVVIRLIQTFPEIRLPRTEPHGIVGTEKQTMTLVLSSARGCKVEIAC